MYNGRYNQTQINQERTTGIGSSIIEYPARKTQGAIYRGRFISSVSKPRQRIPSVKETIVKEPKIITKAIKEAKPSILKELEPLKQRAIEIALKIL